jgi:hypothetical protein
MKLTEILDDYLIELRTRDKELLGQGLEHNVYPSLDPNKVIKVGEAKYLAKWLPMFKKHPELFPIYYRDGRVKDMPKVAYVVLERLNTKLFIEDFLRLDLILPKIGFHNGAYSAIKSCRYNEDKYDRTIDKINEINPKMSEFFIKLFDNVNAVDKLLPWHTKIDFHEGQFGYDDKRNIKCLDV